MRTIFINHIPVYLSSFRIDRFDRTLVMLVSPQPYGKPVPVYIEETYPMQAAIINELINSTGMRLSFFLGQSQSTEPESTEPATGNTQMWYQLVTRRIYTQATCERYNQNEQSSHLN